MDIEIKNSLKILKQKEILLYPTDTVWGIGCDATSQEAVSKVFEIKQRSESKSLVILVDSIEMIKKHIPTVSKAVLEILANPKTPTTIIYDNPIGLAKNVVATDNTVAIRIVQHEFCKELIYQFGKPLVSTSANISGKPTPKCFNEIEKSIVDSVHYAVNLEREEVNEKSSTILKIDEKGNITVLRN
ncbi:L-threonylcarbamoyladenylate synthase [Lutibacter sp.]|uniref:L-threonylcarbamoyladenylate synthase n=1 Tax=Lutibacter sp. TaxID=1925666 RepID=UPI0035670579